MSALKSRHKTREAVDSNPPWIGFLFIVVTITDNCLITIDPLEGKMQKDMNN